MPLTVHESLATVEALRAGRSAARETTPGECSRKSAPEWSIENNLQKCPVWIILPLLDSYRFLKLGPLLSGHLVSEQVGLPLFGDIVNVTVYVSMVMPR